MSRKWKLLFLILLIASISIQAYSIYASTTAVENGWKKRRWCYRVHPLEYIADDCWNLTNPDQYILDAIQNPGEWTLPFDRKDSTFWFIAPWREHYNITLYNELGRKPKPFLYNGTCYDYDVCYAESDVVVEVLSKPPEKYWNVTKLDKRLLWGVKNPGKPFPMLCLDDYPAPPHPFLYNGTYYDYKIIGEIDIKEYPFPNTLKPEYTALGITVIWGAVSSIYLAGNRREP